MSDIYFSKIEIVTDSSKYIGENYRITSLNGFDKTVTIQWNGRAEILVRGMETYHISGLDYEGDVDITYGEKKTVAICREVIPPMWISTGYCNIDRSYSDVSIAHNNAGQDRYILMTAFSGQYMHDGADTKVNYALEKWDDFGLEIFPTSTADTYEFLDMGSIPIHPTKADGTVQTSGGGRFAWAIFRVPTGKTAKMRARYNDESETTKQTLSWTQYGWSVWDIGFWLDHPFRLKPVIASSEGPYRPARIRLGKGNKQLLVMGAQVGRTSNGNSFAKLSNNLDFVYNAYHDGVYTPWGVHQYVLSNTSNSYRPFMAIADTRKGETNIALGSQSVSGVSGLVAFELLDT